MFTVDLITPVVDDPRTFGRIAAANSLSDVYAMGGRPIMALNVSCFTPKAPPGVLREILAGAGEIAREAVCPILGGHTVKDQEIKYGLAVVGEVHPDRVFRKGGAQPGDAIVITKALGTSALCTALKAGRFDEGSPWFGPLVASMGQLNAAPVEIARRFGAHAMTDVTGFGLSGHLGEMAAASGLCFEIDFRALPVFEGALELLAEGFTCGGSRANTSFAEGRLEITRTLRPEEIEVLHDPQTSGPMILCLPAERAESAVEALHQAGFPRSAQIGRVVEGLGGSVRVR